MDTFGAEPHPHAVLDGASLDDVRAQIKRLEDEHKARGVALSGRVLNVCHYLPVTCTLASHNSSSGSLLSPPQTPPTKAADVEPRLPSDVPAVNVSDDAVAAATAAASAARELADNGARWILGPRHGHSAMISGIRSLSDTHQQVVVGWTGDIEVTNTGVKAPMDVLSDDDKVALEESITNYKAAEEEDDTMTTYVPVWLDHKSAHGHYDGYCKQTLWPLFHYLLWQDVATEYASADAHWSPYVAVNETFAQRIAEIYRPGDLIWIHDYHLLLLPKLLRAIIPEAFIGLFVHTPFPSSEVFRCLPRRKEILDGMLGANLVCFQTYSYSRHFISSCIRVCGYETAPNNIGIDVEGHVAAVLHCPVGVDADRVQRDIARPGITPKLEALRALYEGKKIIVGRDKLDVVKGVLQKLRAFEKLLQDYPEWIGNVVLIQVTSPSLTDSPKLERQVSELVAHINGEYGSLDFIPVHHYHQTIKKDEFYALLSVADLAVITPLRDGMNTTSIEFVLAQNTSKKSPLILSEFMGISFNMSDALQINPWSLGDVASAMNHGLLMSESEKLRRHENLYKTVTTQTSQTWAATLVKLLLSQLGNENKAHQTPVLDQDKMRAKFHSAKKRIFFFDYDGTLTPIVRLPHMAVPTEDSLKALSLLCADPRNVVYIISGRDTEFLEEHWAHLKNLGMSAEHGGFLKEPGGEGWVNLTKTLDMSWMSEVEDIFKYYTERTTGSHVEMKQSSITWHYRASDPEWGLFQCRQCQDLLENNLARKRPIEVLVGKKNLEVRPLAVNKGEIVRRLLYNHSDAEFIFCAGDDKTDEDMFRALLLFPVGTTKAKLQPPVSLSLLSKAATQPVELSVSSDGIFSTTVGHSSKRTLASWHVTSPAEVVTHMLDLVDAEATASAPADPRASAGESKL